MKYDFSKERDQWQGLIDTANMMLEGELTEDERKQWQAALTIAKDEIEK